MGGQAVQPGGMAQYLIPLAVFAVIFAFRVRRMSRLRPLKLEQLWVVPAIYLAVVVAALASHPPTPFGWALVAAGLAVGALLGWVRGRTIIIHVDPDTHKLGQRASPLGALILLVVVGGRMAVRAGGAAADLDLAAVADALLGVALGTFTAMRVEMFLRARRLLAAARLGR